MGGKGYTTKYKYKLSKKAKIRLGIPDNATDIQVTKIGGMIRITYKEVIDGITYIRTKWVTLEEKEIRR